MSDLTKTITVSLAVKLQHESMGGNRYESSDLFECESEEVLASMDADECREVWLELRRRVEGRIQERKTALIEELRNPPPF